VGWVQDIMAKGLWCGVFGCGQLCAEEDQ